MEAAPPFDGSDYRRTVLTPLRSSPPGAVEDLFWLGHVPRDLDDDGQIAARLKAAKAFLHKERSRPRQADVAAAVLREWPRVEGVLGDLAARASLRARLGDAAPGAEVLGAAPDDAGGGSTSGGLDPAARRRRQVAAALGELARLRAEPELAEDLFAFLGLPVTATASMLGSRVDQVGEVNRRRRPDRERSLVDELLMHSRELLIDGDPADYRAGLAADQSGAPARESNRAPAASRDGLTPNPSATRAAPVSSPPQSPSSADATPKIDYRRKPKPPPAPEREPDAAAPQGPPPPVLGLTLTRESQGGLRVTWQWPVGVTEVFVATGPRGGPDSPGVGRKVTNARYEIDGGVRLESVAPDEVVTVHTGRRDAAGVMHWNEPQYAARGLAP